MDTLPSTGARSKPSRLNVPKSVSERPAYQRIAQSNVGRRFRRVARQAPLVDRPVRFFVAGMLELPGIHPYRLRRSNAPVWLRHPVDSWTLGDIFVQRVYEIPEEIMRALPAGPVHILDLGANIGLFGLFAREVLPDCRIVGYEPDPWNVEVLRRNVASGVRAGWYKVVDAAAGAADATIRFAAGLGDCSHEAATGIPVSKRDVLPAMGECGLVKMDIEGGEWEILEDGRLDASGPTAIVLEYHHASRCPGPDPRAEAERLLRARGYGLVATEGEQAGSDRGVLWALRSS
jgi:FkbM family methyltransferase